MRSINGLKESTKFAKEQYTSWKASYIKEHFGRPLEKLHVNILPLLNEIGKSFKILNSIELFRKSRRQN